MSGGQAEVVGQEICGAGNQGMTYGMRKKREGGRGRGEVRTLRLLEEPFDAAGAQLYRLPLSYRRDFVCKTYDINLLYLICDSG